MARYFRLSDGRKVTADNDGAVRELIKWGVDNKIGVSEYFIYQDPQNKRYEVDAWARERALQHPALKGAVNVGEMGPRTAPDLNKPAQEPQKKQLQQSEPTTNVDLRNVRNTSKAVEYQHPGGGFQEFYSQVQSGKVTAPQVKNIDPAKYTEEQLNKNITEPRLREAYQSWQNRRTETPYQPNSQTRLDKAVSERERIGRDIENLVLARPPDSETELLKNWKISYEGEVDKYNFYTEQIIPYRATGLNAAQRELADSAAKWADKYPALAATVGQLGMGLWGLATSPYNLITAGMGRDNEAYYALRQGISQGLAGEGLWNDVGSGFYSFGLVAPLAIGTALSGGTASPLLAKALGVAGTATMQMSITSDIMRELYQDDNYLSFMEAGAAAVSGAAQQLTENLSLSFQTKALSNAFKLGGQAGLRQATSELVRKAFAPTLGEQAVGLLQTFGTEILEENLQWAEDAVIQNVMLGKPMPTWEETKQAVRDNTIGALFGVVLQSGAMMGVQARQSRTSAQALKALAADESGWTSPKLAQQAIDQLTAGQIGEAAETAQKAHQALISSDAAMDEKAKRHVLKAVGSVYGAANMYDAQTAANVFIEEKAAKKELAALEQEKRKLEKAIPSQQTEDKLFLLNEKIEEADAELVRLQGVITENAHQKEIYNILNEASEAEQKARKAGDKALDKLTDSKAYNEATPEQQRQMMKDAVLSDKKSAKLQEKADQKYREANLYKLRQTPAYKQAAPEVQTQMEEAELQRQQEAIAAEFEAARQKAISEQQEAEKAAETASNEATEEIEVIPDIIDQLEAKKAALRQERQDINKELTEYRKLMDQQGGWLPSVTPEQKKAYHEVKQRQKEVNRKLNEVGIEIRKEKAAQKKAAAEQQKPKKKAKPKEKKKTEKPQETEAKEQPKKSKKAEAKETEKKEKPETKKEAPQKEKEAESEPEKAPKKAPKKDAEPETKTELPAIEPYTPSARMRGGDKLRTEKFYRLYKLEKLRDAGVKKVMLGSATVGIETAIKRTQNSLGATSQSEYWEWKKKRDTPIDADKIAAEGKVIPDEVLKDYPELQTPETDTETNTQENTTEKEAEPKNQTVKVYRTSDGTKRVTSKNDGGSVAGSLDLNDIKQQMLAIKSDPALRDQYSGQWRDSRAQAQFSELRRQRDELLAKTSGQPSPAAIQAEQQRVWSERVESAKSLAPFARLAATRLNVSEWSVYSGPHRYTVQSHHKAANGWKCTCSVYRHEGRCRHADYLRYLHGADLDLSVYDAPRKRPDWVRPGNAVDVDVETAEIREQLNDIAREKRLPNGKYKSEALQETLPTIPDKTADDALLGMVKSHILSITRKDRTTTVNFKDGRQLVINHITQEAMLTEAGKTGVMYAGRTQGEKGKKNVYKAIVDLVDGLNQGNRTLFHESFHVVWKLFLNSEQISYINQYYRAKANKGELVRKYVVTRQGTEMAIYWTKEQFNALNKERQAEALEEGAAYGFEHWLGSRTDTAPTTMIGKLWQRLADAIRHALVKLGVANQNAKLNDIFHAVASDKLTGQGEQGAETRNKVTDAERIVGAHAIINGKHYTGTTHGDTLNQAMKDGEVIIKKDGYYYDKDGSPLWGDGWNDYFITNTGRVLDRFDALSEFGIAGAEDMDEQATRYKPVPTADMGENKTTKSPYRAYLTPFRGDITKPKILSRLKNNNAPKGRIKLFEEIRKFDSAEELSDHIFYHGTTNYIDKGLKPSIAFSDRFVEQSGGGGYGQKYWAISLSKSKNIASNFSGTQRAVTVYPVILRKGANVISMPDIQDAADLDDIIVNLWKNEIDAVYIGDPNGGEQELAVLNPKAIYTFDNPDTYAVFGKQRLNNLTPERIAEIYQIAQDRKGAVDRIRELPKEERRGAIRELTGDIRFKPVPTAAEVAEAERQYAEVEAKYKGTAGWLKAPNGKPTNLNERQWVQVRTPNFKKWFGDWENDPKNASKVVDENGEPMVLYNGRKTLTTKYPVKTKGYVSNNFLGSWEVERNGAFFTDNKEYARQYGEHINPVFLNIRWLGEHSEQQQNDFTETLSPFEERDLWLSAKNINQAWKLFDGEIGDRFVSYLKNDAMYDGYTFQEDMVLDDFSNLESNTYVVFSPTQIKSATANVGTFDQSNPDIRYKVLPNLDKDALIAEAGKHETIDEFIATIFDAPPEYGISHRPSWDGAPPVSNLLDGDMLPRDVYDHPEWSIMGYGYPEAERESWNVIMSVRNQPDKIITVYRAASENSLNIGDWVTLSRLYAKTHSEGHGGGVYSFEVKARDVLFAGDYINEFGYYPKDLLTDIWNEAKNTRYRKLTDRERAMRDDVWNEIMGRPPTPRVQTRPKVQTEPPEKEPERKSEPQRPQPARPSQSKPPTEAEIDVLSERIGKDLGIAPAQVKEKLGRQMMAAWREAQGDISRLMESAAIRNFEEWVENNKPEGTDSRDLTWHWEEMLEYAAKVGLSREQIAQMVKSDRFDATAIGINLFQRMNYVGKLLVETEATLADRNWGTPAEREQKEAQYGILQAQFDELQAAYAMQGSEAGTVLWTRRQNKAQYLENLTRAAQALESKINRGAVELAEMRQELDELERTISDLEKSFEMLLRVMDGKRYKDITEMNDAELEAERQKQAEQLNDLRNRAEHLKYAIEQKVAAMQADKGRQEETQTQIRKIRKTGRKAKVIEIKERKPDVHDWIRAAWYNSVLAGVPTHMVNMSANVVNSLLEDVITLFAQGGKVAGAQFAEKVRALFSNYEQLDPKTGEKIKTGAFAKAKEEFTSPQEFSKKNEVILKGNKLFMGIQFSTKFLGAEDMLAFFPNERGMLKSLAFDESKRTGRSVADLMENPTSDMLRQAYYEAKRNTFNQNPEGYVGVLIEAINKFYNALDQSGGGGKAIGNLIRFNVMPFTRVLGNVLNATIDYTPLGMIRYFAYKSDNPNSLLNRQRKDQNGRPLWLDENGDRMVSPFKARDARRQAARVALGTILGSLLYFLTMSADDDDEDKWFISGAGPQDYKKYKQLMAAGWRPFSFHIGNVIISYKEWPVSGAFAVIGNLHDIQKYDGKTRPQDWLDKTIYATMGVASSFLDRSFASNAISTATALDRGDPKWVKRSLTSTTSSTIIPYNNMLRFIENTYNRDLYTPETIAQQAWASVPLVPKKGLPRRVNVFGMYEKKDPATARLAMTDNVGLVVPDTKKTREIFQTVRKNNLFLSETTKREHRVDPYVGKRGIPEEDKQYIWLQGKDHENFRVMRGTEYVRLLNEPQNYNLIMQYDKNKDKDELAALLTSLGRKATAYATEETLKAYQRGELKHKYNTYNKSREEED